MSAAEPRDLAVAGPPAQIRPASALVPTNIEQAISLAKLMADGGLVPQHLQDKPANCLMVIEQAIRWGMSPFAVAQCTSVIQGKLMYEGKLVAAVINARGELAERLRFSYEGRDRDRTCTVSGRLRGESEARTVQVTFGLVRSRNEAWDRQPDQQLAYYGARVWARRHLPEVMLGVYGPDEPFEDEPTPTPEQVAWANYRGPVAPAAIKCDGNHGGPRCGDPECWNDDPPKAQVTKSGGGLAKPNEATTWEIVTSSPSASGVAPSASVAPSTEASAAQPPTSGPSADIAMQVVKNAFPGATERAPVAGVDYEEWGEADPRVAEHYPGDAEFRDLVETWTWKGARGNTKWGQGDGEWVHRAMEPQRSDAQNKLIHVLKKERGFDKNDGEWRKKLGARFNKDTSADLSVREAGILIDAMEKANAQHGTADQKAEKQRARARRMVDEVANELGARGIGPGDIERG